MSQPQMDWDAVYRDESAPPWSIGTPQPELAALIEQGEVRGQVLDAGCGHAELSLALAGAGYSVIGLDASPTAVAAASAAAQRRGLTTAQFARVDVTDFGGYDGRFNTVIDSGLLHSLPVDRRSSYLQAIYRSAAPGADLFILAFGDQAFQSDVPGPNGFTEDELRACVGAVWTVDFVRAAKLYAKNTPMFDAAPPMRQVERIADGRIAMPGWLLGAHKHGRAPRRGPQT